MPAIINAPMPSGTSTPGVGVLRDEAAEALINNFGPSAVLSQMLEQKQGYGREVAATTLAEAVKIHGGFSATQTVQLREFVRLQQGWHTVFAPLQRTDKHLLTITTVIPNKFALDRNPESVAPRFVTERSETRSFTLAHFNLGARFFHEFYKTSEGIAQAKARQLTILQAAVISSKLTVAMAAVANGFYHRKMRARSGFKYKNVFDAMSRDIQLFGIFMKDKFAIYKIAQDIDEMTQQSAAGGEYTPLNNFVVGSGLLNQITVSNKGETNPTSREASVASKMLSLGARALPSVLPNRTIYEDVAWSLENVPADEMHVFRRIATIGQYYMIDGSRAGASGPVSIVDELSVKIPDADRDDYTRYGIEDALRHDMRFTATGELSSKHEAFIRNLPDIINKTGLRPSDARAIDPYIWRATNALDSSVNSSNVSARDYRVVGFIGDIDYLFWSKAQMMKHASAASEAARQTAQVSSEFSSGLREFRSLVNELYSLPTSMTVSEQNALYLYIYALYKLNVNPNNNGFVANTFGSLRLPIVHVIDAANELYAFGYNDKILSLGTAADAKVTKHALGAVADVIDADKKHPVLFRPHFARPWGFASLNHFRTLAELVDNKVYKHYNQSYFVRAREIVRILDTYLEVLARIYGNSEIWSAFYVPSYAASGTGDEHYDSLHSVATNIIDRVRHPLWINGAKIGGVDVKNLSSSSWTEQTLNIFETAQKQQNPDANFSASFLGQIIDAVWAVKDKWDIGKHQNNEPALNFITDRLKTFYEKPEEISAIYKAIGNKPIDVATTIAFVTTDTSRYALKGVKDANELFMNNFNKSFANITTEIAKNYGFHEQVQFVDTVVSNAQLRDLINNFNNHSAMGLSLNTSMNTNYIAPFEYVLANAVLSYVTARIKNQPFAAQEKRLAYTFAILVNYLRMLHYRHNVTTPLTDRMITKAIQDNQIAPSARVQADPTNGDGVNLLRKRARDDGVAAVSSNMDGYINTRLLLHPGVYSVLAPVIIDGASVVGTIIFAEHPDVGNPLAPPPTGGPVNASTMFTSHSRNAFGSLNNTVFANQTLLNTNPYDSNKRTRVDYFSSLPTSVRNDSDRAQRVGLGSAFDTRGPRYMTGAVRNNINGPLYSVDSESAKSTIAQITERHNLIARLDAMSAEAPDEETRIAGMLALLSRVHRSTFEAQLNFNLPIPMSCYIIAHPFVRIETEAMLAFAAGAGTLYYANEDVSNQYENASKQWLLHYTIWLGCYIADESKLMVLPDVRIVRYVGGLDLQVYDNLDEFDARSLDFKKSAFVFSCGGTFSRDVALKCANPLSLFGKYDVRQFPYSFENEQRIFSQAPQWPGALFYNSIWDFSAMVRADEASVENYKRLVDEVGVTGLLYMGTHYAWSHNDRDYKSELRGTGHLGNLRAPFTATFSSGISYDSHRE
jgi:hypothetical protein